MGGWAAGPLSCAIGNRVRTAWWISRAIRSLNYRNGSPERAVPAGIHDRSPRRPDHEPIFTVAVSVWLLAPSRAAGLPAAAPRKLPPAAFLMREGVWTEGSTASMTEENPETHSGFVALIGAPNAGKSTLVNRLVGAKVSIVTHKVQTTRAIVRGIATHDNAQIVFVDTPGIFKPQRAARQGDGDDRLGRRQGCRHRPGADRCRARHHAATPRPFSTSSRTCASRSSWSSTRSTGSSRKRCSRWPSRPMSAPPSSAPSWFRR